jgi:hypothetical protein
MKTLKLIIAASLAAVATGAFANSRVTVSESENAATVAGRADVMAMQSAEPVVSRPSNEVTPGQAIEEGPVPEAVHANAIDVNQVAGRS